MLPYGSKNQKDAGKVRPLICLGNNGDRQGRARKGSIATCSEDWIAQLAAIFTREFPQENAVAINNPFSGGFISNAHFWHKGVPWIQIEINRTLYEPASSLAHPDDEREKRALQVKEKIWHVLTEFRDTIRDL